MSEREIDLNADHYRRMSMDRVPQQRVSRETRCRVIFFQQLLNDAM